MDYWKDPKLFSPKSTALKLWLRTKKHNLGYPQDTERDLQLSKTYRKDGSIVAKLVLKSKALISIIRIQSDLFSNGQNLRC